MKSEFAPEAAFRVSLGQSADFDLGGMRVSPSRRQVTFAGDTRTLEPRVMQVLVALAENRPAVVSRDQLALACWGGLNIGDDAINRCVVSLRRLAREFDPQPFTIETIPRVGYSLREAGPAGVVRARKTSARHLLIPALLAAAVLVVALLLWHPWQRSKTIRVAVAPASASADSANLARDLTAKLGMLNSVSEGRARLLDRAKDESADFRFEVDASAQGAQVETNLVLLNERRDLLWSKDFRQPRTNLPDLAQRLAFTAGMVLECALDTEADEAPRLHRQTVKLYLNGCAAFADANEFSLRNLDKVLDEVTRQAPDFAPGWRKLLLAEAEILDAYDRTESDKAHARRIVADAARVRPALPEIDIVRAALLPTAAVASRMRLVEQAANRAPDDGDILTVYALYLSRVGRLRTAVDVARRAVEVNPLSPQNREVLISELGMAGRIAEAQEELRQAELLWPGAQTLRHARYLLHLRFADPRDAIRLRDSGIRMPTASPIQGSFLTARANPTPANVEQALRDARAAYARDPRTIAHFAQTLGEFGREEELFPILLSWNDPDSAKLVLAVVFRPSLHNFRRDPRMIRVAQRLGVLDYWRSSGQWPDFCFEPDLPYNCKREAAALVREAH